MSAETIGSAAVPDENRLPEGFEPLACRLREARPGAPGALPARIPRSRAANGPNCTVCTGDSVHEPVHARPWRSPDASYRTLWPPSQSAQARPRWHKAALESQVLLTRQATGA